jgi:hypothetical protein
MAEKTYNLELTAVEVEVLADYHRDEAVGHARDTEYTVAVQEQEREQELRRLLK